MSELKRFCPNCRQFVNAHKKKNSLGKCLALFIAVPFVGFVSRGFGALLLLGAIIYLIVGLCQGSGEPQCPMCKCTKLLVEKEPEQ